MFNLMLRQWINSDYVGCLNELTDKFYQDSYFAMPYKKRIIVNIIMY